MILFISIDMEGIPGTLTGNRKRQIVHLLKTVCSIIFKK